MSQVINEHAKGGAAAFILLIALVAAGTFIGGAVIAIIASVSGATIDPSAMEQLTVSDRMTIRVLLMINQVFSFILPGIVFIKYFSPPGHLKSLYEIGSALKAPVILLSIAFLAAASPIVLFSYELNSDLLEFLGRNVQGNTMPRVLRTILQMDIPPEFLTNLFLIALVPAVGEELVFRGLAMKILQRMSGSVHLGIWLSAMMFSFFHFQIEGFLPRMVLGLVLGYTYQWSRSLWIPMLLHLLNNGLQVTAIYYGLSRYSELELEQLPDVPIYLIGVSLISLYLTARLLQRYGRKDI